MYFFIVNPKSRSGLGKKIWNQIEAILLQKNISYKVFFTRYPHHATKIAKNLSQNNKSQTWVILGGDGTVNEVLCGISHFSNITLGYIPTGSSNDLARDLQLPTDPAKALEIVLNPKEYIFKDVGMIQYGEQTRAFSVSAGMGFDAAVSCEALQSKTKNFFNKIKLGKLTYAGIALKRLALFQPYACTLILDQNQTIEFKKCYFTAFMIHKYEGGGFKFCPDANYNDSLLDICVVDRLHKLQILFLLPTAFFGLHTKVKNVHIYRCNSAVLKSTTPQFVHVDGETCKTQTEIAVNCGTEKIKVIIK